MEYWLQIGLFTCLKLLLIVLGVPKTTPRFSDLLGGLIGLNIKSYSQLWFITAKGYKAKLAKGKVHGVKSGEQAQTSKSTLPVESHRTHLISPATRLTAYVICCHQEALWRLSTQGFYWGLLTCLACTKILDSQKEQVFSVNHVVCTNRLGTVSHSHHFRKIFYQCRKLSNIQVLRSQPDRLF